MTPKEKAAEILSNFSFLQYNQDTGLKMKGNNTIELKSAVKQCAMIFVNDLIYNNEECAEDGSFILVADINYWKQVKAEIENL